METIHDVLYFLSKLDLVGYSESSDYDKYNWIKKILIDEFQDLDLEELINMLAVLDKLYILFKTQNFQNVQMFTNILREDIFSLVKLSNN